MISHMTTPILAIPPSGHIVNVSLINSSATIHVPTAAFVRNPIRGHEILHVPAYVFLVEHASGQKILFDLGVRRDLESLPPVVYNAMQGNFTIEVEKDIATILVEDGRIALDEINSVIWSHWHLDHNGDPSTFPSTTDLVVGPGFKEAFLPGYPTNPNGLILESDYEGRNLQQINFSDDFKIGNFKAFDFFGDGSFYLLDCPGHTIGHICGLARTTPDTFVFMGGDGCHHAGAMRPTEFVPLPDELSPNPFSQPAHKSGTVCPGSLLKEIHPKGDMTVPYYSQLSAAKGRNVTEAEDTIAKMAVFDASDQAFVIIAHDGSLLDVVDFFPKTINNWSQKGWKEASRWRFLADFNAAIQSTTED